MGLRRWQLCLPCLEGGVPVVPGLDGHWSYLTMTTFSVTGSSIFSPNLDWNKSLPRCVSSRTDLRMCSAASPLLPARVSPICALTACHRWHRQTGGHRKESFKTS